MNNGPDSRLNMRSLSLPEREVVSLEYFDPEKELRPEARAELRRRFEEADLARTGEELYANFGAGLSFLEAKRMRMSANHWSALFMRYATPEAERKPSFLHYAAALRVLGILDESRIREKKTSLLKDAVAFAYTGATSVIGVSAIACDSAILGIDPQLPAGTEERLTTERKRFMSDPHHSDQKAAAFAAFLANMKHAGFLDTPTPEEWKYLKWGFASYEKLAFNPRPDEPETIMLLRFASNLRVLSSKWITISDDGIDMPFLKQKELKVEKHEPVPPLSHLP